MTQIGLMLEGQDGLNWTRWERMLKAAEDFGYQCVFRSDHFTNANPPDKDSLELWVSLTYAASHTKRIQFGPCVAPVTFRHPAITVRMAAALSDLSEGRLVLGLGAGWQEREHNHFGVPFYDRSTRFAMLNEALEVTTQLLNSDTPVTLTGQHFPLNEAILLPRPKHNTPIMIGGKGPKKTLPMVAKYADEWNATYLPPDAFRDLNLQLTALVEKEGRLQNSIKRSLMTRVIYAKDDAALHVKLEGQTADELMKRGVIVGTASAIVDQIGKLAEAGVERIMMQWFELDNIADIEFMARDVLPHFHK